MSNIDKIVLEYNLEILEISRLQQVTQFIESDTFLFNSVLDSQISTVLATLSMEKIKIFWLDSLWIIALNILEKEEDRDLIKAKTDSFIQTYKTYITELYDNSENSIQSEIYSETLKKKQDIIHSLINIGLNSERNLNKLKLDIRINSNQFNKIIENEKYGNTGNV